MLQPDTSTFGTIANVSTSEFLNGNWKLTEEEPKSVYLGLKNSLSEWFTAQDTFYKNISWWQTTERDFTQLIIPTQVYRAHVDTDFHTEYVLFYSKSFNSTVSKLPPKTVEERLLTFVDDSQQIIDLLTTRDYNDAVWKLDELNDSISKVVLSQILPFETNQALDNLSDSLKLCNKIIYKTLVEHGDIEEFIRSKNIPEFLQGVKNILNAYAHVEEWQNRMNNEWGEQ